MKLKKGSEASWAVFFLALGGGGLFCFYGIQTGPTLPILSEIIASKPFQILKIVNLHVFL